MFGNMSRKLSGQLHQSQRTGSTVIFVLFIMLIAMLITTTVTAVVIANLKSAVAYKEHAHAYYAMDSGLERALFYLQYARSERIYGATETLNTIKTFTGTLANASSYRLAPAFNEDYRTNLSQHATAQWDIYQENYVPGYHIEPVTSLDQVSIEWNPSASCGGTSEVEISYSPWTEFTWEDFTDPSSLTTHYIATCAAYACTYTIGLDSTYLYKVSVQPLSCDISNVGVQPIDSTGAQLFVPGYIDLIATGTFGTIQRSGQATIPWNAALNPYFEYVIFAEDEVTK